MRSSTGATSRRGDEPLAVPAGEHPELDRVPAIGAIGEPDGGAVGLQHQRAGGRLERFGRFAGPPGPPGPPGLPDRRRLGRADRRADPDALTTDRRRGDRRPGQPVRPLGRLPMVGRRAQAHESGEQPGAGAPPTPHAERRLDHPPARPAARTGVPGALDRHGATPRQHLPRPRPAAPGAA
jgi:hypothetical protein